MITFDELKNQFSSFDTQPLARGGQKEVFKAVHPQYGDVVVKLLFKFDERAEREIDIARVNRFDHVPLIYDVVEINFNGSDTTAIIEQFINGQELRNIIASGYKYGLLEATMFLEQSLRIIDSIWKKGIVHRDIKPENIKIGDNQEVYFLDFGIARDLSATSITKTNHGGPHTAGYAAPELFMGGKKDVDTRADLFSIGVVTYEIITGVNPFIEKARNTFDIYVHTATVTPVQYQIVGDSQHQFMGLISSLMNKQRLARPRDAEYALELLDSVRLTFTADEGV